ncbi:Kinase, NEK [Giardia lamblia P15]|uniref:non-specific serine/threonine protein kinase n=1 Tax=Giardia intestinalis (strain P15) TaxID=658858 RepID=E1EVN8_GIAIA|nr:Kinase, NEK [Giardia lamblia P15]
MTTKVDAKMRANLHRLIGHGAFGAVYSLKNNSKDVIKVIDLVKLTDDVLAILQSEISILPKMKHRNIIEYKQIVCGERYLYIRMTYYPETLRDIITSHTSSGKCLSDTQILDIAQQLSEALAYLHSPMKRDSDGRLLPPIIHRDIKPENILVSKDRTTYVLADFGLCRVLERNQYANTTAGTPFYTAPEIRQKRKYDTKADMWSLGAVLYELATGERPNLPLQWRQEDAAMHWKRVFSKLRNDYIRAIISHLLISDQNDRSTAAELLQLLKEFEGSILLCQQSVSSDSSTSSLGATNIAESPFLPTSSTSSIASHQEGRDNATIETRTTETDSNNLTEVYRRIDKLSERHHSMTGQLLQLVELCQELRAENRELRTQLRNISVCHLDQERLSTAIRLKLEASTQINQLDLDIKRVISEIVPIETRITELARENNIIKNRLSDQEIKLHELDIAVKILEDTCDELRPPSARFKGTDSFSDLEN